jgi:hypothetical protein
MPCPGARCCLVRVKGGCVASRPKRGGGRGSGCCHRKRSLMAAGHRAGLPQGSQPPFWAHCGTSPSVGLRLLAHPRRPVVGGADAGARPSSSSAPFSPVLRWWARPLLKAGTVAPSREGHSAVSPTVAKEELCKEAMWGASVLPSSAIPSTDLRGPSIRPPRQIDFSSARPQGKRKTRNERLIVVGDDPPGRSHQTGVLSRCTSAGLGRGLVWTLEGACPSSSH